MTVPTTTPPTPKPAFKPTPDQLARESSRKRFNWLFVYIPAILLVLIVLGLVVTMIWAVLTTSPEDHLFGFVSGVADIVLITFVILPAMLLCTIGPALAGFMIYRANEKRQLTAEERRGKLQRLLWRFDQLVMTAQTQLRDSYLDQAARPLIKGHALAAALRNLSAQIRRFLTRTKG